MFMNFRGGLLFRLPNHRIGAGKIGYSNRFGHFRSSS